MTKSVRSSLLSLEPTVKRRAAYSLAAGAAACTAASTADAAVNYSGLQNLSVQLGFSQNLDMDLDGDGDVTLKNFSFLGGPYQGGTVNYAPGQFVGFSSGLNYVSALSVYDPIDSTTVGPSFYGSLAYGAANPNAQFNNVSNAFIGLSFPDGPDLHFGWVRVNIDNAAGTFLIKDWAYSDTTVAALAGNPPGAGGIQAGDTGDGFVPEPGSLGLLAAGAAGLIGFRRRRTASV